jgi:hypothetical protein
LRKHLTVDVEYEQLLAQARDALSHAMPGASEVEIFHADYPSDSTLDTTSFHHLAGDGFARFPREE